MADIQPYQKFKQELSQFSDSGELHLPKNVSPVAFKNAALVAAQDNPSILECDRPSLFKSLRRLAAGGLVPDGREAALVPFKTKKDGEYIKAVQAMPMVFGLIKTARNSGEVADIRAHIVYQNEVDQERFVLISGDDERLEHNPIVFGERGDAVGAYAIAKLKDGSVIREFMSAEDIDKVRRSGASQRIFAKGKRPTVSDEPIGIWADWTEEMWKKTVIRRLCKRLPVSSEDMRHMMVDEETSAPEVAKPKPTANLSDVIQGKEEAPKSDVEDAEVVGEEEPTHWTDAIATDEADPATQPYVDGWVAYREGHDRITCQLEDDLAAAAAWLMGWDDAREAAERKARSGV
jgi:recombination protein RecT